jgi:microcystin degradation protein MlrC
MSVYDCRQIQSYPTTIQPMRGLVDRIMAMEGKDGILSVSIAHCFPTATWPRSARGAGDRRRRQEEGRCAGHQLGEELVSLRGKTRRPTSTSRPGVGDGVAFNDLPVVIADPADNAGGGAPSDNTDILKHLIATNVQDACIGPIWDPIAVRICFDAGSGRRSTCASAARSPSRPASRSMPRSR